MHVRGTCKGASLPPGSSGRLPAVLPLLHRYRRPASVPISPQALHHAHTSLPKTEAFHEADLSRDPRADLEAAE